MIKIPEGYIKTGVGVIPETWEIVELGNIGKNLIGLTYSPNDVAEYGTLVLRSSNVQNNKLAFKNNVFVNMELPNRVIVKENDILICVRNGSKQLIGKCALIDKKTEGVAFGAFMSIYRSEFNSFIFYQFQSNIIQRQIDEIMGATINQITNKDMAVFKVPLPRDTKEQTAIANALSDVDALITSLEKLFTKKRAIKTAAMQQLLTGKKRLPGFDENWKIISMNSDANLKARIGWQALTTSEYLDQGDFYLVTGTDFKDGRVNWSTCHYVDEWRYKQDKNIQLINGDVLLTKDGTIGKVGYVENLNGPATLNSGVFVIRPVQNAFNSMYLFYVLLSRIFDEFLNRITAGSTITHLYQKDFVTFEFEAPNLEEQEKIAEVFSSMDYELKIIESRLIKTKQLKQGMMQELLTGRTRLV